MGIISKPRLLLAVAGLWTLVLMFWYHESLTPLARWAQLPSSIFKPGSEGVTAENALANDNAHKLPTADSFLGHFRKVVQIPGITVAEAQRSCNWDAALPVNFQFDDHVDWAEKLRSDDEVATRRGQWRKFITEEAIPYEAVKQRFGGRGLVIVAGNGDTISRAKVSLRALRKLGSKIPIEFHYWNDEMNGSIKADLAGLYPNLFFNDLSGEHNIVRVQKNFFRINYQLKPAALMNSRFAEPLLLDTDNIPVLDPATLYDTKTYQEYGTVFWPDIARTRPQNPAWAITNTPCRMNEYEVESGQLLVDKTRFWYHLQLAAWMSNDTAGYYDEFLLGDKDMFRFSWHALKTRYGQPKKWLTSVGTLNDGFYCGHTFAQHHPDDGRVAFLHGGLTKTVSPEVLRWNRVERGGFYRHYKRSISDERPDKITNVTIKFDGADYVPSHSANFRVAMCTDMFNTEARDLNEILPGFEALFEEIRGYWQLDRVH